MIRLVFWMNMPSFYQSDLFRALLASREVDLKVMFANRIPEDRARLGWQDDLEGFDHEFLDERHPVMDAFSKAVRCRGSINIVGGLWAGKIIETVLAALLLSRSRYFIYSEAPDPRNTMPPFKRRILLSVGSPIVRKAAGFLTISHFASDYFKSLGVDKSRLHPFGYFRSLPGHPAAEAHAGRKENIDVVYVGQLVHRKGLDILLSAMEPLFAVHGNLRLQLIGSGDMRTELENWVSARNLSNQVSFEGSVSPRQITERISGADLLVLPSRWDGWGLVVNEALMAGIPVIVSDMCGAADVIRDGINGYVFRSEEAPELRNKIEAFVKSEHLRASFSEAALETGKGLGPENAAKFLLDVLEGRARQGEEESGYAWIVG